MKADLITGFLGAGKTTFIRKYLHYLRQQGEKLLIIENEFGSVSVDTTLLTHDCKEEDVPIDDLTGACMCCVGKQQFRSMIIRAAAEGYDRILVEPSGIYDVDEFFSVMESDSVKACCEIGNILTIVDSALANEPNIPADTEYLMACQILAAGRVLISKSQLYPEAQSVKTAAYLNTLMENLGIRRRFLTGQDLWIRDWNSFADADYSELAGSGWNLCTHDRRYLDHASIFSPVMVGGRCMDLADLTAQVNALFRDPDQRFGYVLRVKGHIRDLNKNWYRVNCTRDTMEIDPVEKTRGLMVVIGQNLNEDAIVENFVRS